VTRILFDVACLDDRPSGTKTRLERLVPALEARGHHVTLAIVPARRSRVGRWLRPRALEAAASRSRADVVVFETFPAPRVAVPAIAVIHDLRHVRAGGLRRALMMRFLRDAARRVRRFHVVSETVRAELAEVLPEARDRIDVVPNCVVVEPEGAAAGDEVELPDGPFVFAAGHAETRKDWPFVEAVAKALAPSGIKVVRAGRGLTPYPNLIDLGVVEDADRDALMKAAVAVLAPSRLEGFGLVPLEALACGGCVVASRIAAHVEVLGDAAAFFEPGDVGAAVDAVLAASKAAPEQRASMIARGRARAALWSPEHAADAFEASLRAALG
jgi:glycosyltransferase involved in cell wall biosynthesis